MIFCISASWSLPKPFSASPCSNLARVSGALHRARSSASSLKNSGSLPKSISMNCWADIGVPSGCQNVVTIMCWMARALPSASLTLIFAGRALGTALALDGASASVVASPPFAFAAPSVVLVLRLAVPLRIVEMVMRLHEIVDREVILAVVSRVPRPMICLNSIIELIGRISTMLRMLRASTPVESFCDVVRIVGMVFSLS